MSSLDNTGSSASAVPKARKVTPLLGIGIFLLPIIFAWFTLRKGYSTLAKVVAFGWLGLLVIVAGTGDRPSTSHAERDGRSFSRTAADVIVDPQMNALTDKVARDAVAQYDLTRSGGDKMDICVHAGIAAAAYLQAKDQSNYLKWKATQKQDCRAAGMPGLG